MQSAGAAVSYNIVIAISKGIVVERLHFRCDGRSLFKRIRFRNRKATIAKVSILPEFLKDIYFFKVLNVLLIHLTPRKI